MKVHSPQLLFGAQWPPGVLAPPWESLGWAHSQKDMKATSLGTVSNPQALDLLIVTHRVKWSSGEHNPIAYRTVPILALCAHGFAFSLGKNEFWRTEKMVHQVGEVSAEQAWGSELRSPEPKKRKEPGMVCTSITLTQGGAEMTGSFGIHWPPNLAIQWALDSARHCLKKWSGEQ